MKVAERSWQWLGIIKDFRRFDDFGSLDFPAPTGTLPWKPGMSGDAGLRSFRHRL